MTPTCSEPFSAQQLIAYDLGELDLVEQERVESHYFSCPSCTARLSALMDLGEQVREVVRCGKVTVSVSARFVEEATHRGLRIRRYVLGPSEQVACTVAPDDDFVAICLSVGPAGPAPMDIAVDWTTLDTQAEAHGLVEDVLVDREAGQVILLFSGDQVRSFPKSQWRMTARAGARRTESPDLSGPAGASTLRIGPFTLNHTPWHELHAE